MESTLYTKKPVVIKLPILEGIKQWESMVNLRDFPE